MSERFKKFSDWKKEKMEEVDPSDLGITPKTDEDRPMFPNLPKDSKKIERMPSRKGIIPVDQNVDLPKYKTKKEEEAEKKAIEKEEDKVNEGDVKFYGKIAKLPNKTKASKGLNFLENVKISKNSIWYILVEKQENELQMVKYNNKKGVDLGQFVKELKSFYVSKTEDIRHKELIESIDIHGAPEFSAIRNIPNIEIDGKKMISKITEDLIKLLSK
jgi:hypothetical protein